VKCIAFEGRLLVVGFPGGRIADVVTNRILLKNVAVIGVHLGLYRQQRPEQAWCWMTNLLALAAAHRMQPVVFKTFPLREAAQALGVLAGRASYGKGC
jgi:NADPH2:quinone reductase